MISELRRYLSETPREQIDADWKAVKDRNYNGPTIEEFMRNNLFKEALEQVPDHTTEKIRNYTDMIDKLEDIIDGAYELYMPQVRSEITDLAQFLIAQKGSEPWNILEIGTKFGGTFYIWNRINPNGMNISIDLDDGGLHGGIGTEKMDERDYDFKVMFENCHFIRGDSHDYSTANRAFEIIEPNPLMPTYVDFLFIDGDHSYEGVKHDWEMYSPFLKKGGIVAFHDTVVSDRHHERDVYVGEFWRELTKNRMPENQSICIINGQAWEIVEFIEPGNDWAGISTLTKL